MSISRPPLCLRQQPRSVHGDVQLIEAIQVRRPLPHVGALKEIVERRERQQITVRPAHFDDEWAQRLTMRAGAPYAFAAIARNLRKPFGPRPGGA
jgi:hypothetical protein